MTTEDAIRLIQVQLFPVMLVSVGATDTKVGGLVLRVGIVLRDCGTYMYICSCLTYA